MKRVAIYVRVSTARQDQEGYSIPLQKERLIAYCKAKGWIVSGIFTDPGHSGSTLDRPGMVSLIAAINDGKFDAVLVYKLDRLSRSQKDTLYLIEDVFLSNQVDFISMMESFDTSSSFGKAMIGMLSVFAQLERENITARTLMGRSGRAQNGFWHGGGDWPIGYDYVDGGLVVNASEAAQVRMVYKLFAAGNSVSEISRRMDGYSTKHGDWRHTSTIGNVLDNPLYSGTVRFDGVSSKGQHLAIVEESLNARVKSLRAKLRLIETSLDSDYLLTGLIFCASCGARYFAHKRPNGNAVYSCHSRAKKNKKMVKDPSCKFPHIPVHDLDAMVGSEIFRLAENPALVDEMIKKRAAGDDSSFADESISRLDREISRLMDLYQQDDLVSVEEIAARISKLHEERMRLYPVSGGKDYNIEAFRMVLRDARNCWGNVDGRRSWVLQLVDKIHIDAEGIRVDWSI